MILEYLGGIETCWNGRKIAYLGNQILEYLGGIETPPAISESNWCGQILEYLGGIETM